MKNHDIVLFDGVCNFCNSSINLVIDNDPNVYFKFVSLQSTLGQTLTEKYQLKNIDTVILISNNKAYTKSTAALKIAKKLKGLWPLTNIFIIIPTFVRDIVYDIIAKNRYKWFGKSDSCRMPTPELKERFLS